MPFDILNVTTVKHKRLSLIIEKFYDFKTKLTFRYIFGAKKNENSCVRYMEIDEET